MNTLIELSDIKAKDIRFGLDKFFVILEDGRELGVPYNWYTRLAQATKKERENWRFIGGGYGIHWEDIDEDISIAGILKGNKSQNNTRKTA